MNSSVIGLSHLAPDPACDEMPMSYPLPYSLARLQARVGGLPSEGEWRRLSAIEGMAAFLHAVRSGPMSPWTLPGDARGGVHDIERQLRHDLWRQIEELMRWLPLSWHPALHWTSYLPYLEIFAYLERGGDLYPWMREDMLLFSYLSPVLDLPAGRRRLPALPATWAEGWRQRLPSGGNREGKASGRLATALLAAAGAGEEGDRWQSHRELEAALLRLFHGHCTSPLAVFAYLGLILLQARRLRAELQRRLLFPARGTAP
jgi:hypothetical protein